MINKLQDEYKNKQTELQASHHREKMILLQQYSIKYALQNKEVSISGLQRCFLIGYNQASTLSEWLTIQSHISKPDYSGIKVSLIYNLDKN